jgi:hypothetical protein
LWADFLLLSACEELMDDDLFAWILVIAWLAVCWAVLEVFL